MSLAPNDPANPLSPYEAAVRQRTILARIVRMAFLVLFVTVTLLSIVILEPGGQGSIDIGGYAIQRTWPVTLGAALIIISLVILVDIYTPTKRISTLGAIFFGLLVATLATIVLGHVIDLLVLLYDIADASLVATIKVLVGIALAYFGITTVLQTQDDFRLVIPYVEFAKQIRGPRPFVLDTSALIDARIADLAGTGIIQTPLVVPRFVVGELQRLADSGDKLKRARGRRGLDIVVRLQQAPGLDVSIDETHVPGKAVDQMIVELARGMPATVVTADVALAQIAGIQGVPVLNLNDVANSLKPSRLPGEQFDVDLIKPGEQAGQAVGYLDDGTMVVAEDGGAYIGRRVTLNLTSTLQTSAGRLLFGRVVLPERHAPASSAAPAAASATGEGAPRPHSPDPARPAEPRPRSARNPRR